MNSSTIHDSSGKTSTKPNYRWTWMAGSAAIGGSAGISSAETVQILQADSRLTMATNTIQSDLTGDGIPDLPNLNFFQSLSATNNGTNLAGTFFNFSYYNRVGINSGTGPNTTGRAFGGGKLIGVASYFTGYLSTRVSVLMPFTRASSYTDYYAYVGTIAQSQGATGQDLTNFVPVTFQDIRVNGNQLTNGFLEVRAFSTSKVEHTVEFLRLIFDNASTDAPTVNPGDPLPDADLPAIVRTNPNTALIAIAIKKIKKVKKQIRQARQSGNSAKVQKLRKRLKKEQRRLRSLR